jgi:hypothetical protein
MGAYLDYGYHYQIDGLNFIRLTRAELEEWAARCYYSRFDTGGYYYPVESHISGRVWPAEVDPLDYSMEFEWQDVD